MQLKCLRGDGKRTLNTAVRNEALVSAGSGGVVFGLFETGMGLETVSTAVDGQLYTDASLSRCSDSRISRGGLDCLTTLKSEVG